MMKLLRRITSHFNFWPLVLVIFFGLLAGRTLLPPGYFNMHDDLQMMRQLEMEKCFLDFQIPCRWVPDMGYGFGFPLFNFYPPLPYLIGQVFRTVGFSFVVTIKLTFILSFVVSGVTMYFLAKEFFGKVGGILSSVFYVWAPYHAVDVFVRGAMNEAWALAWFPLILLTGYHLIRNTKYKIRWEIVLGLSWTALLLSHNLMILIFTPVFGIWCLIFLWRNKKWERVKNLILSGLLALGLSAFFTIPAILEQKYVQVNTLTAGYYEYIAHFASINQLLISRFWGYGPSIWGDNDGMPFPVGHFHWILSLVIAVLASYGFLKSRKNLLIHHSSLVILFFVAVGWLSAFMAHSRSTPIWRVLPTLKFVQFPWRFLTLTTLSFSFIVGALTLFIKNKKTMFTVTGLLILGLLFFSWNYFKPQNGKLGPLTDEQKFTAAAWELQQTAGIYDYLPKDAVQAPQEPRKYLAEILEGSGEITNQSEGTNWGKFTAKIESENAKIRIGIFKFPDWRVFVDGKVVEIYIDKDEIWGRTYIDLAKGNHDVSLKLFNTPVRSVSNLISISAWTFLLAFPYLKRKIKPGFFKREPRYSMAKLKNYFLLALVLFLVLLFYGFVAKLYFAQDDFFHLRVSQTDGSLKAFLNLFSFKSFSERGGIYFYRPIFREGLFNIFHRVFGLEPLPFRLFQLVIHLTNTILVYKLVKSLTKKEAASLVASLVFGLSAANVGVISYLAGGLQASGMTMFLLVSILCFLKGQKNSAFLFFLLGLASHELAVAYPFVLGGLVFVRHKSPRGLWPYIVALGVFLYLQVAIIGLPTSETQYGLNFSIGRFINSYAWYFVWSLGIPEMLLDFVGPGLKLNPNLMNFWGSYFRIIFPLFVFILAGLLVGVRKIFKNKFLRLFIFWFVVGIFPVIFLPFHRSTYYLAFPLVGIAGLIGFVFEYLYKNNRALGYLLIGSFVALSLLTIQMSKKTFWAITRAKIAKELLMDIKNTYPSLPKGATVYFLDDSGYPVINKEWGGSTKQAKVALSGSDAISLLYKDESIIVLYEEDSLVAKGKYVFPVVAKIRI